MNTDQKQFSQTPHYLPCSQQRIWFPRTRILEWSTVYFHYPETLPKMIFSQSRQFHTSESKDTKIFKNVSDEKRECENFNHLRLVFEVLQQKPQANVFEWWQFFHSLLDQLQMAWKPPIFSYFLELLGLISALDERMCSQWTETMYIKLYFCTFNNQKVWPIKWIWKIFTKRNDDRNNVPNLKTYRTYSKCSIRIRNRKQ